MKWLELGDMVTCLDTDIVYVIIQENIMSADSRGYIGIPLFVEGNQNRTWFFPSQENKKWKRHSSA